MDNLTQLYQQLIHEIGEEGQREGLQKTPERAAKALRYLTKGYQENLQDIVNGALFPTTSDDLVIVKNIELYSLCEHHLLPFIGKCHVGYLPRGKVLGVSKLARIVDLFARRLQIQEQLTHQIAEAIAETTDAVGVGVVIEAQHLCMMMRGVEKQNSVLTTSSMLGLLRRNSQTRAEFLSLVK
ncbi:MAG: GTP cyclohydrolase I FolE [Legionellales bacterium]|nr:GTP cyclohydrolase I FolE [Legionellales bacterium]